ncbi:hypothetical protein [Streptomyces sp. NPDC046870]|uniref:hypothetical protein n=1 Tax=Streptomyces sp. NPDC046870 TaxID=3155135 RepID=UPI0034539963
MRASHIVCHFHDHARYSRVCDLVEHLAGEERVPKEELRAQLANYAGRSLVAGPPQG